MKVKVTIEEIKSIDEVPGYWKTEDFEALLKAFDFSDVDTLDPSEYREMLYMAISDFEADEAAKIFLEYKFSERLTEGQIDNLSHEMLEDKVSEEYPDTAFHYDLFNINQLLFKAYNGTFPPVKASKIVINLVPKDTNAKVDEAFILKALQHGLSDKNLIIRLFEDSLTGKVAFDDAENILWEVHPGDTNQYTVITGDYWLNKEDLVAMEFEGEVTEAPEVVEE